MRISDWSSDVCSSDLVRLMQEKWIGRSVGATMRFAIVGRDDRLEVFTTRPDTIFGACFCALSPDHPLAGQLAEADTELAEFVAERRRLSTKSEARREGKECGRSARTR